MPISLQTVFPQIEDLNLDKFLIKASLTPRVRARLYRKLASLARTGMPLPRALDAIWQVASMGGRRPKESLAQAIRAWREKVYDGHPFGEALAGWVPSRERMVIEAGAADLGQALDDAAGLIDSSRRMMGAVFNAVSYPTFLGALLATLIWIFSVDAIPAFAEIKPMDRWTGLAASLAVLSTAVHAGLLPFLGLVVTALALALWSLPRWTGEWRRRFDWLPPWSFYRLVAGMGFLTSLVAFIRAGMPVPEALRRLRQTSNPWLGERIDAALFYLNSGHDLGEALHLSGYVFPSRAVVEDLRIYASLGNIDEALQRLSGEWVKESLDLLHSVAETTKVGGMILVAATVAWIQLGIISVQQQLTGGF